MEDTELEWRKSSYSGPNGGECVEVGTSPILELVGLRDTKSRERGMLAVSRKTFAVLLADMKRGQLDLP
ncbi:MAG TPA: DUF397 domain-containing protein [Streptosporangiaceae bacterium]|jgi:hypothetical protein|nr:DUF397 domain-containing protein [Streptosporangiaceae bacterium]